MLTHEQSAAVNARGNTLLMAGAGTGKTSTLVARVLSHLLDPVHRVALDRILMVTFTEAAAAEMRHRLRLGLEARLTQVPEEVWLAEQLVRLDSAPIGTLHGFCLRLLREHFHELGLDPQLRVLDTSEARQLFETVLDQVLDPLLGVEEGDGTGVALWISRMMGGDVVGAREFLRRVHDFLRSRHDSAAWLGRQLEHWKSEGGAVWLGEIQSELPDWVRAWRRELEPWVASNPRASACDAAMGRVLESVERLDAGWREAAVAGLRAVLDVGLKSSGRGAAKDPRPALPSHFSRLMDDASFLVSLLERGSGGADPLDEDWKGVQGHMLALLRLTERLAMEFATAKRELGALDFSDLEQFALQLLGDGGTEVAGAARERFEHVLVDEAQDLNPAQSAILAALSRSGPGANRFLVGDVKQSIYRFRLADPGIFQAIAGAWSGQNLLETGVADSGNVLPLTANFRSHEGVLAFVNDLFPRWMRRAVGGVEYDAGAALQFGNRQGRPHFVLGEVPRVEVHLRLTGADEGEGDGIPGGEVVEETPEAEAAIVVERLMEMRRDAIQIWDPKLKCERSMRWGDVVVLMRSPGTRGVSFARKFTEAGIPLATPPGSLHTQPEVRDLLNGLRVLDNPVQDIPLAAVLRSPLVGMDDVNDLALIRVSAVGETFWTALNRFVELGKDRGLGEHGEEPDSSVNPLEVETPNEGAEPEAGAFDVFEEGEGAGGSKGVFEDPDTAVRARRLWSKGSQFLERYGRWRKLAQRGSMAELLETILDDTAYEAGLTDQSNVAQRVANLRTLLDLARRFDASQRGGLLRFLGFLQAHDEAEVEAPVVAGVDAVRLMSIHASKGLEFPVTVVAGLGTRFNLRDLTANVVLGRGGEVCPVVVTASGDRYPSWPMWRAAWGLRCEMMGEELRLLYVAFTRACDRLILVGSAAQSSVEKWMQQPLPLSDSWVINAQNSLQWLVPTLANACGSELAQPGKFGRTALYDWKTYSGSSPNERENGVESRTGSDRLSSEDSVEVSALSSGKSWRYVHEAATHEAAKQSVTALRRRAAEVEDESVKRFRGADGQFRIRREHSGKTVVEFNAAERGTLHHRFLEYVDLRRTGSRAELDAELERLKKEKRLDEAEAGAIDLDAMERLWGSELGRELRAASEEVRREIPFTMRLTPGDLERLGLPYAKGLDSEEFVVVQGVIDIAVWRPGNTCWIGDFKTDQVAPEGLADKAALYAPQLALYALALKRIYGRTATRQWLYFLSIDRVVDVGGGEGLTTI